MRNSWCSGFFMSYHFFALFLPLFLAPRQSSGGFPPLFPTDTRSTLGKAGCLGTTEKPAQHF